MRGKWRLIWRLISALIRTAVNLAWRLLDEVIGTGVHWNIQDGTVAMLTRNILEHAFIKTTDEQATGKKYFHTPGHRSKNALTWGRFEESEAPAETVKTDYTATGSRSSDQVFILKISRNPVGGSSSNTSDRWASESTNPIGEDGPRKGVTANLRIRSNHRF